jgi:hypothetical protein
MNKKIASSVIITILIITVFSGCNEQKNTETSDVHDEVTVSTFGGYFALAEDKVNLNIPNGAVEGKITIIVDKINNEPDIQDYTFVTGYNFQPDGLEFLAPITLEISYDDSDIPIGIDEEDLKICLYENNQLTEIDNCLNFPSYNLIRGQINHFSAYWVCSPTVTDSYNESEKNTSAIIRFEAGPIKFVEKHWVYPEDNPIWENYQLYGFFVWDPVSYVRFYEVTYNSTGTYPATGWYLNWNDYKKSEFPSPTSFLHEDPEIYIYGDYKYYPGYGYFVTIYNNLHGNFPEKHGIEVFNILAQWDVSQGSLSYESLDVIEADIKAMNDLASEWTQGWFVTVRAVT